MPKSVEEQELGAGRSTALLRSYRKGLFWSRLMLAAFFTVFVATMLWATPWLPYGLETEDYDPRTLFLLLLILMAALTALGAVYLRDRCRHIEQTLLTWTTVHQGLSDVRRREYFYDRIVVECERAKARGAEFTVVALRVELEDADSVTNSRKLETALGALEPLIKDYDCLAALSSHEIGILAPRVISPDAPAFVDSLLELVREAFDAASPVSLHAGWAVFGGEASDAGGLVGLARSKLARLQYAA